MYNTTSGTYAEEEAFLVLRFKIVAISECGNSSKPMNAEGNCTTAKKTPHFDNSTTTSPSYTGPVIAGITSAVILLLVLCVVGFVLYKRYHFY